MYKLEFIMSDSLYYLLIDLLTHTHTHTHTISVLKNILNIFHQSVCLLYNVATVLYFCFLTLQNEKIHSSQFSLFKLNYV